MNIHVSVFIIVGVALLTLVTVSSPHACSTNTAPSLGATLTIVTTTFLFTVKTKSSTRTNYNKKIYINQKYNEKKNIKLKRKQNLNFVLKMPKINKNSQKGENATKQISNTVDTKI